MGEGAVKEAHDIFFIEKPIPKTEKAKPQNDLPTDDEPTVKMRFAVLHDNGTESVWEQSISVYL
jgi:hypothetical protein